MNEGGFPNGAGNDWDHRHISKLFNEVIIQVRSGVIFFISLRTNQFCNQRVDPCWSQKENSEFKFSLSRPKSPTSYFYSLWNRFQYFPISALQMHLGVFCLRNHKSFFFFSRKMVSCEKYRKQESTAELDVVKKKKKLTARQTEVLDRLKLDLMTVLDEEWWYCQSSNSFGVISL